jgi:hypothetical protein
MAVNAGPSDTVQRNSTPVRKVSAGAFSGAVVIFIVAVLNNYVLKDKPITAEISSAATTIVTFLVGYLVPPGSGEVTMQAPDGKVMSAVRRP